MKQININDLIAKYLSGNASEKEKKEVETWRKEGNNELTFRDMENLWQLSAVGKESFLPDTEVAWKKFRSMVKEEPVVESSGKNRRFYAIAAAAAVIPFIIFIFLFPANEVVTPLQSLSVISEEADTSLLNSQEMAREGVTDGMAMNIPSNIIANLVVTTDSVQEFYLPDSTKVWLNKKSKFSYPEKFTSDKRIVSLEGEAFFEVKRDPAHPFIIYTPTSITKVLGTSFNLKAYGKEVELMVVSGTVEFSSIKDPEHTKLVLKARDKASLKDNVVTQKKVKNYNKELAWKKGPKSQTKFRRFLNKIKNIFKKQEKDK
jgi:transmembrane sensor